MIDLKLDASGDLEVESGDLELVDGVMAVVQSIGVTWGIHQGEWLFDTSRGVPWRQDVLTKPIDPTLVQAAIDTSTRSVEGVVDIESIELDLDAGTRRLTFDVRVVIDNTDGAQQPVSLQGELGALGDVGLLTLPIAMLPRIT